MFRWSAATLFMIAMTCQTAAGAVTTQDVVHNAPWRQGDMDQAYADAKRDNKPMLLYWGAVWCPPCNELKNQIFAQSRFKELVKPLIAVYLDGDNQNAQTWGEKLKISGYPTVLLIGPQGDEWMRLTTSADMNEFELALTSALAAGGPAKDALARAEAGKATDSDWRLLAYYSWYEADSLALTPAVALAKHGMLVKNVPAKLKTERALLASNALTALATAVKEASDDSALKTAIATAKAEVPAWLEIALSDTAAHRAARGFLIYESADLVSWYEPKPTPARLKLEARVVAAAAGLAMDKSLSVDTRLWSINPKLTFAQKTLGEDADGTKLPAALRKEVQAAVGQADKDAVSIYDRHAVISGAAYLLRQIGDLDGARAMLMAELKKTDTPWYYESSFASLEKAAGNKEAALKWAAAARTSVKGRASRVQWIVEDLSMTSKLLAPLDDGADARLNEVVKDYYDTALAEPDGFAGRNQARANKVADSLKAWMSSPKIRATVSAAADRCAKQSNKAADAACRKHFSGLLTGA